MTKVIKHKAIVIGTGAAGFATAFYLKKFGVTDVAIITEGVSFGTSRNAGSDKQTYYKLSLSGDKNDSVRLMGENLFDGGAVDGDNALCEAALSSRCFFNLCDIGIPFPHNEYGEYVGYKTDHDPFERATSAGPLTSKFMTEALEKKARELGVKIYDKTLAIELLLSDEGVAGVLAFDIKKGKLQAFSSPNIIMATGGPSGIYKDNVYPESQTGSTGLAVMKGAKLQNLSEWQYGLASVNPKWNVSGTYMQCIPRFVSVDEDGGEYEFLGEYYSDPYEAMSKIFLKGYQWPFDSDKIKNGSSEIDLYVYKETAERKRKVYLDFTKNPFNLEKLEFEKLSKEAYNYLKSAKADFGTPIERLCKMNEPAYRLYLDKGVDLNEEKLEIALSAQHNNGGISVNSYWETSIKGLFAVGECAGTHGVKRPGGSALNAGQVGALRSAEYISRSERNWNKLKFDSALNEALERHKENLRKANCGKMDIDDLEFCLKKEMSDFAGAVRKAGKLFEMRKETETYINSFWENISVKNKKDLYKAYKLYDMLYARFAVSLSMEDFWNKTKTSRGGSVFLGEENSDCEKAKEYLSKIQVVSFENGKGVVSYRDVRAIPAENEAFEVMWKKYRENFKG